VVAFMNPECSDSRALEALLQEMVEQYGLSIRVVVKLVPDYVDEDSPSVAVLAADRQGKFWEMFEALLGHAGALQPDVVEASARDLGLDMARFRTDRRSAELLRIVRENEVLSGKLHAAMPFLFVNGHPLPQASRDSLVRVLDHEMTQAIAVMRERGVAAADLYEYLTDHGIETLDPEIYVRPAPDRPFRGSQDARVVFDLFTDYDSESCGELEVGIRRLVRESGRDVKVVYRHLPHGADGNSWLAAEASVEADRQGKFMEFNDLLFLNRASITRADLEGYAVQLHLDVAAFRLALDHRTHRAVVEDDVRSAEAAVGHVIEAPVLFTGDGWWREGWLAHEVLRDRLAIASLRTPRVPSVLGALER
jgi:protein-disulfide isomerase